MINSFKKTRIAPTPSGFLHTGNVLSFALTAALARKAGARIVLRIDDLDRERIRDRYVQDVFDTLAFLKIPWDEGPKTFAQYKQEYSQRHRMELYNQALQQLENSGAVFACTCSRAQVSSNNAGGIYLGTCIGKRLPLDTPGACWRLYTEEAGMLTIRTIDGIVNAALPPDMHHLVVRKKDGCPAYQFASVIDDLHFGIDMVVRGMDLWPSTLAQHYLAGRLGRQEFGDITFYHHPLLATLTGEKLSKSAGSTSIQQLRKEHKKPADIYTLIARMLHIEGEPKTWMELGDLVGYRG